MPLNGFLFRNKLIPPFLRHSTGLTNYKESAISDFGLTNAAGFVCCTGSTTIADATPAQSANITILGDESVPPGMRCYLTCVIMTLEGAVNWSNTSPTAGSIPYLSLQDSAGVPAVMAPFSSLRGLNSYQFPTSSASLPLLLGPGTVNGPGGTPITTFTYVASTGVITAGATSFISTIGIGGIARVVDGTGKGQAAFVTAVTATTATVSPPFTGLDATSVIGFDFQSLQTYTDTTHVTLWAGGGTPYTANILDNGFNVVGILGAGVGQVRGIAANTTAGALTLGSALDTAMNNTTTQVRIANNNEVGGVIDCCVGGVTATLTPNRGLQLAVNNMAGTSPVGSAVRVYVEGFFNF